jgi:hypothetical protein
LYAFFLCSIAFKCIQLAYEQKTYVISGGLSELVKSPTSMPTQDYTDLFNTAEIPEDMDDPFTDTEDFSTSPQQRRSLLNPSY